MTAVRIALLARSTLPRVTVYVFAPKADRFQILTLTYSYRGTGYTDTRRIRHYEGLNGAPGYWEYYIASAV